MEERIAVGSKDYLVGLEVECDGANMLSRDDKAIDHTIGDVLVTHGLNHAWNNDRAGCVVAAEIVYGFTISQLSAYLFGTHGSQLSLIGLGVVVIQR